MRRFLKARKAEFRYSGRMLRIPLTQGKVALIDDEDLPLIADYKWSASSGSAKRRGAHCYSRATLPGIGPRQRWVLMHRLLLKPEPGQQVDHVNGDGLDNRRSNLRLCLHRQNQFNQRKQRRKTSSAFKGVRFCKQTGRWAAVIKIHGRNVWLRRHDTERDAALAYNAAAKRLFGEFANLNEVSRTDSISAEAHPTTLFPLEPFAG
jgi:AP2 domain/HNH endonuclease